MVYFDSNWNYDKLTEKRVSMTYKTTKQRRDYIHIGAKLMGLDFQKATDMLWEELLWLIKTEPSFRELPMKLKVHHTIKEVVSAFLPHLQKNKQPFWEQKVN